MVLQLTKDNIIVGDDLEFMSGIGMGELQMLALRMQGNKILQIDALTGEELTASLLLNRAITLAKWLRTNGVKTGDVVSISCRNRLEFMVLPVALFLIGGVIAPLNPEYTYNELEHVIHLSKPSIIFCSKSVLEVMKKLSIRHTYIRKLVLFGNNRVNDGNIQMYEDIIKGVVDGDIIDYEPVNLDPMDAVACILCSSGTTGLPKGVMITHANMTAMIDIVRAQNINGDGPTEITFLGLIPFFHSMGFMSTFLHMMGGNKVVVMRKFETTLFFKLIEKYKLTMLVIPPPLVLLLVKHPLSNKYNLSSVKDLRCGAAPLGKDLELEIKKKYNLDHISQSYGMTETTLGVLMSRSDSSKPGSVGQIVSGISAKIIDESGKALGPYEEGEICFKGPIIMKGYIGDPVATRNIIDTEGWLHTGDVAYYDKDGFFFIVDRLKELIKYKAFQVAPAELEALLLTHSAVADVAVVGLPDAAAGELPLAYVVKKPGAVVTEKELQNFVAGKVSRQKYLRGGVRFINEIPKNPSGKILRRLLKQKAASTNSKL